MLETDVKIALLEQNDKNIANALDSFSKSMDKSNEYQRETLDIIRKQGEKLASIRSDVDGHEKKITSLQSDIAAVDTKHNDLARLVFSGINRAKGVAWISALVFAGWKAFQTYF